MLQIDHILYVYVRNIHSLAQYDSYSLHIRMFSFPSAIYQAGSEELLVSKETPKPLPPLCISLNEIVDPDPFWQEPSSSKTSRFAWLATPAPPTVLGPPQRKHTTFLAKL